MTSRAYAQIVERNEGRTPQPQFAPSLIGNPLRGGLAIRNACHRRWAEPNAKLRALKSMAVGLFPSTDQGREAMGIHAEEMRKAHEEVK